MDVVELERDDLAGTQAEPRQEQQDGGGVKPACRLTVDGRDHPFDLLGREERRDSGELPSTNRGHGCREISRRRAVEETKAQERA